MSFISALVNIRAACDPHEILIDWFDELEREFDSVVRENRQLRQELDECRRDTRPPLPPSNACDTCGAKIEPWAYRCSECNQNEDLL